ADGTTIRDHRARSGDSDGRFAHESDLGKRNIHAHTFTNPAEGLRQTSDVARPPVRPISTVNAAAVMRGRLANRVATRPSDPWRGQQPQRTYQPPQRTYQPPQRGYQQQPQRTYQPPTYAPQRTYQPPQRGTDNPPSPTYTPP